MSNGIKLSKGAAQKVKAVVTDFLNIATDNTGDRQQRQQGFEIIEAKLTSRDGTDTSLYAWTQARRNGSGWDDLTTTGLKGTTTARPAIDYRPAGYRFDLTNTYVLLKRGVRKISTDDGEGGTTTSLEVVWFIIASAISQGQYQYMQFQMLTDTTYGWAPVKAHPDYS